MILTRLTEKLFVWRHTPTKRELIQSLRSSNLKHSEGAAAAIKSGCKLSSHGSSDALSIAGIYANKSRHLDGNSARYACEVKEFIDELVRNIEEQTPEKILMFRLQASWDIEYLIDVDANSGYPLGCRRYDLNGTFS